MSKIALEGNASGTGTFTIASPNSNSNYTLNLPTSSGTVVVTGGAQTIEFAAGTASAPSITTTGDTNTGIFFPAADTIAFAEGGAESMRIDSSGRVGIGATSINSQAKLEIAFDQELTTLGQSRRLILNDLRGGTNERTEIGFGYASSTTQPAVIGYQTTSNTSNTKGILYFATRDVTTDTAPTERARITSDGTLLVARNGTSGQGVAIEVGSIDVAGVSGLAMHSAISLADDATITLSANTGLLVFIEYFSGSVYPGAMFYCSYAGAVQLVSSSGGNFAATDSDGNACVFKSINTDTVTVKNRLGSTRSYSIHTLHMRGQ